jgi:hypothetical protein
MRIGSPNGESLEFISAVLGVVMRAVVKSRDTLKISLDRFSSRYHLMAIHQTVHRYMGSSGLPCSPLPVCFSEHTVKRLGDQADHTHTVIYHLRGILKPNIALAGCKKQT